MRVSTGNLKWLAVLAVVAAGGCQDPAAQTATAERQARIAEVWGHFVAREEQRPQWARRTIALAERSEQRHKEMFRHNTRRWRQWWLDDVHRWETGQPEYRRRIEAELEGDEAAMQAAIRKMFY